MYKLFPFLIIIFLLACSGQNVAIPTIPAPTATPISSLSLLKEIKLETQTNTAYTLAWSPDGNLLAIASGGEITILNSDLKIQNILQPENGALGVTWNRDQNSFATVNGFHNPAITIL